MTEKEIRKAIESFCEDLDRRRPRGLLLPIILGAGLAVSACDSEPQPEYAAPDTTSSSGVGATGATGGAGGAGAATGGDGGAVVEYMAPDAGVGGDGGAMVEYMAPDAGDGGAVPEYMAP